MTTRSGRPLVRAWLRWKALALEDLPRPSDRPFASERGGAPIECLALGAGSLTGWGVASHQLALVGGVARALAARYDGVAVRGEVDPDHTVASMRVAATQLPWERADLVLLAFGPNEVVAVRSADAWALELTALLDEIRARLHPGALVRVVGIPPIDALRFLSGTRAFRVPQLIARFNERARRVCASLDGVEFVDLPVLPDHGAASRTAESYRLWGWVIAASLPEAFRVDRPPAPEEERVRAVEGLALLDTPAEERFDRVVRLARQVFRARMGAFVIPHDDRVWFKAREGADYGMRPRDESLADFAVREGRPLVVGDATADPRFARMSHVGGGDGLRFFAAYPVRSADGLVVGALCVADPEPRSPEDVDVAVLRDLALMIEAELGA